MSETAPVIGIIGKGYTGGRLWEMFEWGEGSWCTNRVGAEGVIGFEWGDESLWGRLPDLEGVLVVTAAPLLEGLKEEEERLRVWGQWMRKHRSGYKRMVYVSSTGVYANRAGVYREGDEGGEGVSAAGEMRLMTEAVLGESFDLSVVRAGGIYGPGRNIVTRVRGGKGLASRGGGKKVGRIHVDDLAGVVKALVLRDEGMIVNAVDDEAATSLDLLRWVKDTGLNVPAGVIEGAIEACETPEVGVGNIPAGGDRVMSNQRMREVLGYRLKYPTYREGLAAGL